MDDRPAHRVKAWACPCGAKGTGMGKLRAHVYRYHGALIVRRRDPPTTAVDVAPAAGDVQSPPG